MRSILMRTVIGAFLLFSIAGQAIADNLRIATFNINWGNVNLPDIERAIREANADVVCLQETNAVSEQYLTSTFRESHPHVSFVGHRGEYGAERLGFLSRVPLTDVKFVPPADGLFGTCLATIRHERSAITIANVHFSPFVIRRGASFREALGALAHVEDIHRREVETLETLVTTGQPTLVCGDLNSLSTLIAPVRLRALELTDSYAAVNDNADQHPTWHWPVGKTQIQFRIDYVFHTEHFTTVTSTIIPSEGSDHSLVVSELTFQSQR